MLVALVPEGGPRGRGRSVVFAIGPRGIMLFTRGAACLWVAAFRGVVNVVGRIGPEACRPADNELSLWVAKARRSGK